MTALGVMNLSAQQKQVLMSQYQKKRVLITGGASFIGSHVAEIVAEFGGEVTIIDDFSSGSPKNLENLSIDLIVGDLRNREFAFDAIRDFEIIFHLAAIHGGRGFIENNKAMMLANLGIDNNVFSAASSSNTKMLVHASSACAYPINLQESKLDLNYLEESQASMEGINTSFADGVYGWTKLIGEYQLMNFTNESSMKGRSARIFTAYGERENESHAAIALIAKALLKADPFPIWGDGQQTRNFTYVSDTATGLVLLGADARELTFDVFNIGTSDHVKVIDFINEILNQLSWRPSAFDFQLDKPGGVASRASDNSKIMRVFGWQPSVSIEEGVLRTLAWYEKLVDRPNSLFELEQKLMSR
jgi:nucleoside-diphosphate-sugar epimerase